MRVLHLTPELPYWPGSGGGRGREFFLCRRLVERGHDVLNISPVLPREAGHATALRDLGVENWVIQRPASPIEEVARAIGSDPSVLATALTAPVRALEMQVFWIRLSPLVDRALAEWRPDVAIIGHDMAAGWSAGLPPALPAVLTCHNLTWHWYLSRARLASPPAALLLRHEARRYRRYLVARLPRFAAAIAVSSSEDQELRELDLTPVSLIPTGVDTQAVSPVPEQDGPPRVLFTGTLSYEPNYRGIGWFADQVWPAILARIPDAQLEIVGRDPPAQVRALDERPGISVTGPVPSMNPYFARAHVVVVPILTGAGIRVKIVEAMAAGRAIVSTSLGCQGLPYIEPNRHLLLADQPSAFAAETVRLLRDPELRRKITSEARGLAEREYDWRGLGDRQEQVLHEAVETWPAPASSRPEH